eukprot:gnl/Trimastix_PCT/3690.p1 GENE.gnl/Trimastix_PCT/3690~~gnl/Trimastix_PCT/3690.p1  ORF type:complete len:261 (+),score=92.68 gnl/Trimastix_PCT/3690:51-833(+)
MFEVVFEQANILKKLVEAIRELAEQVSFDVSPRGISLQAMDQSRVSLVLMQLNADSFSHFRCDRNFPIGLNLKNLAKILKCANNDDKLTLKAEDNGDALILIFECANNEDKVSTYELKLIEIDCEQLGVGANDHKAVVNLAAPEFQLVCRNLMVIGDTVIIETTKEGITFSVAGEDSSGSITLKQSQPVDDDVVGTSIELEKTVQMTFALKFLNLFCKATPLSDGVQLSMSPDQPLCVEYTIGDLGYLRYYLAPKIEDAE